MSLPSTVIAPRRTRFRTWYETLPTGVQMIGLQLWLPALFVVLFMLCYVFAFHAPAFRNIPVGLVGHTSHVQELAKTLTRSTHGGVSVTVLGTTSDARHDVLSGELAAAYVPSTSRTGTLFVANANGIQLTSFASELFDAIAVQTGTKVSIVDLAPLPTRDSFGTSLFYLTLVCTITGYMVAMFVGMMGAGLKHRQRFTIFGAASLVLPLVAVLLARFVVHAVDGHVLLLWLIGSATSFAVGTVVNGLAYFLGRFVTGAALIVFVFINVPSSGGAFAPALLPEPFRFLHTFVSGTATLNLFRHAIYGSGPEPWQGWTLLASYAAAGVILAAVGKPFFLRRMKRQRQAGWKSMMVTAQIASLTMAGYVTPVAPASPTRAIPPGPRMVATADAGGEAAAAETGAAN